MADYRDADSGDISKGGIKGTPFKTKLPPVYTVLVSMQNDGGGEWIDPEFRGLFSSKEKAEQWGAWWSANHNGFTAAVYECVKKSEVRANTKVEIAEKNGNEWRKDFEEPTLEEVQGIDGIKRLPFDF